MSHEHDRENGGGGVLALHSFRWGTSWHEQVFKLTTIPGLILKDQLYNQADQAGHRCMGFFVGG